MYIYTYVQKDFKVIVRLPPPKKKIINQNMISKHHVSFIFRGVYGVHSVYFFVLEMGLVIKN